MVMGVYRHYIVSWNTPGRKGAISPALLPFALLGLETGSFANRRLKLIAGCDIIKAANGNWRDGVMQRIPDEKCASRCGLFCGACPSFPDECHGCFSDFVREGCKGCAAHGFLDCAVAHNVTRCYECGEFPCTKLKEFSTKPVINGICNHANVIPDSLRMKAVGVSQWVREKITEHKCPKCGRLINWFEMNAHVCD